MDCDYLFKIVMVGDSGVGKTNIMMRFSRNVFSQASKATIGVDFASRNILIDDKYIKIQIWDTAGQERYRAITSSYYRNSSGIMLVYDITNENTFENCEKWLKELRNNMGLSIPILLIGNKSDASHQRTVDENRAKEYAKINSLMFIETSALGGDNVDSAFDILAKYIYETSIKTTIEKPEADIKEKTEQENVIQHIPSPTNKLLAEEQRMTNTHIKKSCC